MARSELPPFHRVLGEEPSDHQRKFLYLPLPIFRDYTNIRSIIIKYYSRKDNKPQKEIEITQKIKRCHAQMEELGKWNELHLDELDFIWSAPERV